MGNFDEGKVFLEKGLGNATKMNNLIALGFIEMQYGYFYLSKGDWQSSKAHLEKGAYYCEKGKHALFTALSWSGLGYVHAMVGEPDTGRNFAEKGLKIYRDSGVEMFFSLAHVSLGQVHMELGDIKTACSLAEEALRLSQKNNEKGMEGWSWLLLGTVLGKTASRKIEKAEECLLKGIKINKELKTKPFYALGHLYLGQLYLNAGEKEKAIKPLKKAEGMFQEMGMDYWLAQSKSGSKSNSADP